MYQRTDTPKMDLSTDYPSRMSVISAARMAAWRYGCRKGTFSRLRFDAAPWMRAQREGSRYKGLLDLQQIEGLSSPH